MKVKKKVDILILLNKKFYRLIKLVILKPIKYFFQNNEKAY